MTIYVFLFCLLSTSPEGKVCKESDPYPTLAACEAVRESMQRDLAWMVKTESCQARETL